MDTYEIDHYQYFISQEHTTSQGIMCLTFGLGL